MDPISQAVHKILTKQFELHQILEATRDYPRLPATTRKVLKLDPINTRLPAHTLVNWCYILVKFEADRTSRS